MKKTGEAIMQKAIWGVLSTWLKKTLVINGVTNEQVLTQPGREDRPVRIETIYALKSLTGTWTLLQDRQSPMLPRAVLMRPGLFGGGRGAAVVIDAGKEISTSVLARGLSFRDAFDRVRAAEEAAKPLVLETQGGCALPASFLLGDISLVQKRPEGDPAYWRNLSKS